MGGPKKARSLTCHVALLRGINVGGKNRIAMEVLRECFAQAGCSDVKSYIQSGNLTFHVHPNEVESLPKRVAIAMEKAVGFSVPVIVRSLTELVATIDAMPFDCSDTSASFQILFLSSVPSTSLDATRSPDDQFALIGDALYVRYGVGIGRSKLTNAYIDKTLQTTSTARNLKTLRALTGLAKAS